MGVYIKTVDYLPPITPPACGGGQGGGIATRSVRRQEPPLTSPPHAGGIVLFIALLFLLIATPTWAADVFQSPEAFVAESFAGQAPVASTLTINANMQKNIKEIMGDHYKIGSPHYWLKDGKSVWVLEEIGKTKPITTGFVVEGGKLEQVKVLVYRESHGWEVKYPFFTDQFKDLALDDDLELDGYVDSIAGATLSVNALRRKAALALYLHKQVVAQTNE